MNKEDGCFVLWMADCDEHREVYLLILHRNHRLQIGSTRTNSYRYVHLVITNESWLNTLQIGFSKLEDFNRNDDDDRTNTSYINATVTCNSNNNNDRNWILEPSGFSSEKQILSGGCSISSTCELPADTKVSKCIFPTRRDRMLTRIRWHDFFMKELILGLQFGLYTDMTGFFDCNRSE